MRYVNTSCFTNLDTCSTDMDEPRPSLHLTAEPKEISPESVHDVQLLKRENCLDMDESIASHSVETVKIEKPHQSLKRSRTKINDVQMKSSHSNSSDSNATSLEDSPFLKMLSDDLDALRSPKNKYAHRSSSKHEKNKTKNEPVKDCFSYYSNCMRDESPVLAHEISSGMPLHAKTDKSFPFQRTIDPREPHMSMLNAQSTRRFIQDSSTSNIAESVINKMLQNIYSTNVNTQPNLQTYLTGFSRSLAESFDGSTQSHSPGQNFPRQHPHSYPTSEQSSGQRQSYLVPNIPPFVMQYQQSHSTQQRPPYMALATGSAHMIPGTYPEDAVENLFFPYITQLAKFWVEVLFQLAVRCKVGVSTHTSFNSFYNPNFISEVSSKLRKWDQLKEVSSTHGGMEFTLMTYNILAQDYLEQNIFLYSRCERKDLEWNNRGPALMAQIIAHNADIVCLQEVQEDHWLQDMKDPLEKHGYLGVFKSKEGGKPDGCAVLYKRDKFHKIKFVPVEFKKGGILNRDNIGIILVLKPIPPRGCTITVPKICVATTHLLFNPKRGDVKLAQLMVLLAEIDKHACIDEDFSCRPSEEASRNSSTCSSSKAENQSSDDPHGHKSKSTYCPIIFCGDLNAEPLSDMYKFITSGYLKYEKCISKLLCGQREGQTDTWSPELGKELLPRSVDITESCQYSHVVRNRYKSESPSDRKLRKNSGEVFHEMNFKSVYNHFIKDRRGHKLTEITSQHECVSATVDYIFYSCSRKHALVEPLVLLSRYRLLTTKDTYKIGYLPNSTFLSYGQIFTELTEGDCFSFLFYYYSRFLD